VFLALHSFPLADGERRIMADIISISLHRRTGYQPPRASGPGASIILFPGVRYERTEGSEDGDPSASSKRTSRGERQRKSQA
jgi:hypothetical protein